jgi:hypothetical protein
MAPGMAGGAESVEANKVDQAMHTSGRKMQCPYQAALDKVLQALCVYGSFRNIPVQQPLVGHDRED